MNREVTVGGVRFDLRLTAVVVLATILPLVDVLDHRLFPVKAYDRVVFYLLVPGLVIVPLFRQTPADYGFRIGRWRRGLLWVAAGWALMALVLALAARIPAVQDYYQQKAPESIGRLIALSAVDLFAWEFMWRGFLLFGLARVLGPGPAIWLQAVPFAFMHLVKPEVEAFSAIFGGAAFGFVAWQTRSFLYPFLIHWFMDSYTMLLAAGRIG
jgi:membrane protease YdiL (CAAX protease family)